MPNKIYTVEIDGKQYDLEGDHPPTEAEARQAVGQAPVPSHEPTKPSEPSALPGLLPTAGGVIGSMAGGVPGAALGGAAGEGFKQLAQHATELPGAIADVARNLVAQPRATLQGAIQGAEEGLQNTGLQAAGQAGAEVGGRVAGKVLSKAAGRLYQSVLKPTVEARAQYPELVKTGLEYAIPVSKGGAQKAAGLVTRSKDAADALVTARGNGVLQRLPNGATIEPGEIYANAVSKAAAKGQDLAVGRAAFQKAAGDAGEQFLAENANGLPLEAAQRQVRTGDRFLNKAYRAAIDRGDTITSGDLAGKVAINDATRAALQSRVPGLADQNAETQALMGVTKAVKRRVGGLGNNNVIGMHHAISTALGGAAGAVAGRDKGLETFAIAEALTNPAIASRLAIAAARGGSGSASAQAIRQALIGLMASHAVEGQ